MTINFIIIKKMESTTFIAMLLVCFLCSIMFVNSSHFRGGMISWRPAGPGESTGNPLEAFLTIRVAWRRDSSAATRCDQSHIDEEGEIGPGDLKCLENCVGLPSIIAPFSVICTDFSVEENWSTGEKTFPFIFANDGHVLLGFSGAAWITLVTGGGGWSIVSSINMTTRRDTGRINSSPRSSLTPIVRLQRGCNHTLEIPVSDPDGDIVRCRWASGAQECAGVCNSFTGAILDQQACTIQYSATGRAGWYAVALMVEDFTPDDTTTLTPLSKIPLQFLVSVFDSAELCSSKPEFVDDTPKAGSCIGVPHNTTWREKIISKAGGTGVSITEINTVSPPGLDKSEVYLLEQPLYAVNVTWTPQINRIESSFFCYTATDSTGSVTPQICISLVGGVEAPMLVENAVGPVLEVLPTQAMWKIQYDKQIIRPFRISTYINFHNAQGAIVYRVDTTSASAKFPFLTASEFVLEVTTTYMFTEKETYFITFDRGIVTGVALSGICAPESFPVRDPHFWRFKILDVTPPVLTFSSISSYTNANVTFAWRFNEAANDTCALQSPDGSITQNVACDWGWTGQDLDGGWYGLFITAVDEAGNISPQTTHTWFVDRTAPAVIFQNQDNVLYLSDSQYTVIFSSSENFCTYTYDVSDGTDVISSGPLSTGRYEVQGLENGKVYTFTVTSIDRVGNVGEKESLVLDIDNVAPTISGLPETVSVVCGEDLSPNNTALGWPVVLDNSDPDPISNYTDHIQEGCQLVRTWDAFDRAGNMAVFKQLITVISPQPPVIGIPDNTIVPCSAATDLSNTADVIKNTVTITHPCNRSVDVTFSDSSDPNQCGVTFTRVWTAEDDCGQSVSKSQTIQILPLLLPEYPEIGQVNVDLQENLRWPQYPLASTYALYLWPNGEDRPQDPTTTTTLRWYYPPQGLLPQNTQMLWQVEYGLTDGAGVRSGPVWGFVTRAYPDLIVSEVVVPDFAYSGQTMEIRYSVENIGGTSTSALNSVKRWADSIYIGTTREFSDAWQIERVWQNRVLDANDGYTDTYAAELLDNEIGLYYVFVKTDHYNNVKEAHRSNNVQVSLSAVNVRLTPPPNLRVTSIVRPSSTFSGLNIRVRYTITNDGTGPTRLSVWYDRIYLSEDDQVDNTDIQLVNNMHSGALQPGDEYTVSQSVYINHKLFGSYHILVQTDVTNVIYEHANEGDNVEKDSETPMEIKLSPPPDLIVSSISGDNIWVTGSTISLEYTVSNEGGGPTFESWWTDSILLKNLASGSTIELKSRTINTRLEPVDSYTYTLLYTVPPHVTTGDYQVQVIVDVDNRVFEFNVSESNNMKDYNVAVIQQLPDLTIDDLEVSIFTNTTSAYAIANYTVRNTGLGATFETEWTDRIRVGQSTGSDTFITSIVIGSILQKNGISASGSYTKTNMVFSIPETFSGSLVLYAIIDYANVVSETNIENNRYRTSIDVPVVLSDLSVKLFELTGNVTSVEAGQTVSIKWTGVNTGNKTILGNVWTDSILLFPDPNSETAYKLNEFQIQNQLAPNDEYSMIENITIPLTLAGDYLVAVMLNSGKDVTESDVVNNENRIPLTILSPPSPDLILVELNHVYNSETRVLLATWKVKNDGNSILNVIDWEDSVFLSPIENANAGIVIGSYELNTLLMSQQIYEGSLTIVLPNNVRGNYYVHVSIDSQNDVAEINGENNNIAFDETLVVLVDLSSNRIQIKIDSLPDLLIQGDVFNFKYTVINVDDKQTLATSWIDAIYISNSPSLTTFQIKEQGFKLTQNTHTGGLASSDSYTVSKNITFPFGVFITDVYFYIVIDENESAGLATGDSSAGASISSSSSVTIEQGPLPDIEFIRYDNIQQSFNIVGGAPFNVDFNITNIGEGGVNLDFYCVLYLSIDPELDPFDVKLHNILHSTAIGINETSVLRFSGITPFDQASGLYYFIVVLDSRDYLYEVSKENNVMSYVVNMMGTVSTDLVVKDVAITTSTEWTYNEAMSFSWKLQNNGSLKAIGYKCDTAYMSTDAKWDLMDVQVGETVCSDIDILPTDGTDSNDEDLSLDSQIPLLIPNSYYGLVRTRSNIRDPDLNNNIAASQNSPEIGLPSLQLEVEVKNIRVKSGSSVAYVVSGVPVDETLLVLLSTDNSDSIHDVYVRYDIPATRYQFVAFSSLPLSANQEVTVENTEEGEYYLLVHNNGVEDSKFDLLAKLARFEMRSVRPKQLSSKGLATVVIMGTLFTEHLEARLITSYKTVTAENVYRFGSTKLFAQFDINGFIPGSYLDIKLLDTLSGAEITLERAIRVIYGKPGTLAVSTQLPRALRTFETSELSINYENIGDSDYASPLFSVQTSGPGLLKIVEDGVPRTFDSQLVLGIPLEGPAGTLPPTGYGTLKFEVSQVALQAQTGRMQIAVQEAPTDDTPNIYLDKKYELKPRSLPDEIWEDIWQNFIELTGSTMETLHTRITDVATSLSLFGRRVSNVDNLVNWILQIAGGYLAGDDLLTIVDLKDEGPISNIMLDVHRLYSPYISKRRKLGPFGRGWINLYLEIELLEVSDDLALIYDNRQEWRIPVADASLLSTLSFDERSGKVFKQSDGYTYYKGGYIFKFDGNTRKPLSLKLDDGTEIAYTYSSVGLVTKLQHSDGQKVMFKYTDEGLIEETRMEDADGNIKIAYYEYNKETKTLSEVTTAGQTVQYNYNSKYDLTKVIYPSGGEAEYSYTSQGYLSKIQGMQPNGLMTESWEFQYKSNGRVVINRQPHDEVIEYVYDERQALLATITNGMASIITTMSAGKVTTTYADQVVLELTFDEKKNTYYSKNAAGAVSSFTLSDIDGRMISFTDPNGNQINSGYYSENRLTTLQYADDSTQSFVYNSNGEVYQAINRDGAAITFEYDPASHMIAKTLNGLPKAYSYDEKHRLVTASSASEDIGIDYDKSGRPLSVTYGTDYEIINTYNDRGQKSSLQDTNGSFRVEYSYDDYYRLAEVKMVKPKDKLILQLEYNVKGYITKRTNGNGASTTYTYAPSTNWILQVVNTFPNGSVVSSYQYVYDKRGRPVEIKTHKGEWKLRYDKTAQLTYWENPNGSKTKIAYDNNGNRVKVEDNNSYGYEVNNLNQYKSFAKRNEQNTYDLNGNVIRTDWQDGNFVEYQYDDESKLTGIQDPSSSCTYKYDALENLKEKICGSQTSKYIVDPFGNYGSDIIIEIKDGEPVYYVHGLQHGLSAKVHGNNIYYYQFDAQGSVVGIQNDAGELTDSYLYDPFGQLMDQSESSNNDFLFIGQWGVMRQNVAGGNLYWMRTRIYDASHGRFLSPDRIGLSGKSTNLYTYALNNPLVFRDPEGKVIPLAIIGAGAIIGAVTNAAIYSVVTHVTGGDFSWSALAGAAVSGGITGAGITLGAPIAGVGGYAVTSLYGALGGAAGYSTTQLIDGKSISGTQLVYEAAFNGILANFPRKMLGWLRSPSEFGRYMFRNPTLRQALTQSDESWPLWLTLTAGNAIATGAKIPADFFWNNWKNLLNDFLDWIRSVDPNDIIGPKGYGDARFIAPFQLMEYKIRFENDANATAPAQRVYIDHPLDSDLDIRTFKLGSFGFGDFIQELDYTRAIYQDMLDFTSDDGFYVHVRAGIDIIAGKATWELLTIDPDTGEQPVDPSIGFLPPNNNVSIGQGFVTFSIKIATGVMSEAVIDAVASIIFDTNEPIATPPIFNTVDSDYPHVNISTSDKYMQSPILELNALDMSSGTKSVDIYRVNVDNTYELLVSAIQEDYAVVPLPMGSTYQLLASAIDNVGNRMDIEEHNVFEVTFPFVEEVSCVALSNCSGNGNCSQYGFCECEEDRFGLDCSSAVPIAEPPIIEASALPGTEDQDIQLNLNARFAQGVTTPEGILQLTVSNIPPGGTFDKAEDNKLILYDGDFGSVIFHPPADFSGEVVLDLAADLVNGQVITRLRESTLVIMIEAVADTPSLEIIGKSCYYESKNTTQIQFESHLQDKDGSEILELYAYNIPLSYLPYSEDALKVTSTNDNRYKLTNTSITNGILRFYLSGNFTSAEVIIEAVAIESSNLDSATVESVVSITEICEGSPPVCDSNPCQHGGQCRDEKSRYVCKCTAQYTGSHCESKITTSAANALSSTVVCVYVMALVTALL